MVAPTGSGPRPAPRRAGTWTKLRYRFDTTLSKGPLAVVAYLGMLTVLVIIGTALLGVVGRITFGGGLNDNFTEELWQAMLRTLDSGTFAADGPWPTRALGLVVTLAGIFLAGSLIGLIANAVDQRVEELRRGRGPVVEADHTLVLGWSPQVPRIVSELVVANSSRRDACVVVLAPEDKNVMDDVVRQRIPHSGTTRVVCRSGDPSNPSDLERACVADARSIVVVRGPDGDAGVVKAILAVKALDPTFANAHVVAELNDPDHARTIRTVSGGRVLTIASDSVVAEVTAQACQQSGLAAVFTDLLDFEGDELYFTPAAPVAGRRYDEAVLAYDAASVIGRITAAGAVELNPPPGTVLGADDQLIVVAEDDSTIAFTGLAPAVVPAPVRARAEATPLRVLLVGWSPFGRDVLRELDEFLPPGSRVDIVVDGDLVDAEVIAAAATAPGLRHTAVEVCIGGGGPEDLLALADGDPFDQVIVLAYRAALGTDDADARTLLTLLTLRLVWPVGSPRHVRIVAELLDQQNLTIANPVGVDDLIVSDALTSLMIAQLSERAELQAVFDDLFDAAGAVVELRSAPSIVPADAVAYASVVAGAAAQGLSAFGYRLGATGTVTVNPPKSATVALGDDDQVLVIATRS